MIEDDDYRRVNQFVLEQFERERGNRNDSVGKQIDDTCDKVNRSVNNSGSFRSRVLSPKAQEMLLVGGYTVCQVLPVVALSACPG